MKMDCNHDFARRRKDIALLAASAALLAACAPGPVAAADTIRVRVETGDLDLSRPADLRKLESRMSMAARRLCRDMMPVYATPDMRHNCVDDILDANRPKVERAASLSSIGGE